MPSTLFSDNHFQFRLPYDALHICVPNVWLRLALWSLKPRLPYSRYSTTCITLREFGQREPSGALSFQRSLFAPLPTAACSRANLCARDLYLDSRYSPPTDYVRPSDYGGFLQH